MLINILTSKIFHPNSLGALFPIYIWNKRFKQNNFRFKIVTNISNLVDCDILIIDSKFHRNLWITNQQEIFADFEYFKKISNKLIYFDTTDSTGSIQIELLDIIDKYWKLQIYKDKNNYLNKYFGDRIFTHHLRKENKLNLEKTFIHGK